MSIIEKLIEKKGFSALEAKIADYIIRNKENISHLTIRELAKETYTGTSSVLRTIKKVYDGGFLNFKIDLAYEIRNSTKRDEVNFQIRKHETAFSVMEKMANVQKDTIDRTKSLLDYKQIERITKMINNSTIIYFFADGMVEQIGYEFKYMISLTGKFVDIATENFLVSLNCLNEKSHPISIYVNHQKNNALLQEKIIMNYKNGIDGIVITGHSNEILKKYCKELITIPSNIIYPDLSIFVFNTATRYLLNVFVGCTMTTN